MSNNIDVKIQREEKKNENTIFTFSRVVGFTGNRTHDRAHLAANHALPLENGSTEMLESMMNIVLKMTSNIQTAAMRGMTCFKVVVEFLQFVFSTALSCAVAPNPIVITPNINWVNDTEAIRNELMRLLRLRNGCAHCVGDCHSCITLGTLHSVLTKWNRYFVLRRTSPNQSESLMFRDMMMNIAPHGGSIIVIVQENNVAK